MAYLTQADLSTRFASLQWWTDDDAAGAIDADIVTEMIALATAEIDAAAGQHYETPLTLDSTTSTPAIIRDKAGTIAGYKLATRRREVDPADALRLDYEDVQKWLEKLAAGKVYLAGETAISSSPPSGQPVFVSTAAAAVTRESMQGL